MSTESGTKSNRFNWKQGRFRLDIRKNFPSIIKDKLSSRLLLWAGGAQSLKVFENRLDEDLSEAVCYSSSHLSTWQ